MDVKVRVRAGARREHFEAAPGNSFNVSVREKALENAANRRVVELVALHFKVPKACVRIMRGHRSSTKIITIG